MANSPIISQETTAALLGRALSETEESNFDLYLKIARQRLEDLLCMSLTTPLPVDLQLLLARCFGTLQAEQKLASRQGITNKKVEDFSISFDSEADNPMTAFAKQNQALLAKYSQCQGRIKSGKPRHDCIRCI